ncbi:MAG: anion transporter [Candidatus Methanomethyliaceae archaeon]|nr:anion transporter [Candidatus Methanomethyliaceae archaeon]
MSPLQLQVLLIFLLVYTLIVVRRVGRMKFEVWTAMLIGAMALLGTGAITLEGAFRAINMDVILFLFGMFLLTEVMAQVGLLQYITVRLIRLAGTPSRLLFIVIFFVGIASAFFVNDAVVLFTTPIVLAACSIAKVRKTPYLLGVALSSNIGSALTPIGNPQNVLIKVESGISFLFFFERMAIPVIFGLISEYFVLKTLYRKDLKMFAGDIQEVRSEMPSKQTSYIVGAIASATLLCFILSDLLGWSISLVAGVGATAALLISPDRRDALRRVDWGSLIFFSSMFIVMESVSKSGLLDSFIQPFQSTLLSSNKTSLLSIFSISLIMSQITSNVPFVALMLPIFKGGGASQAEWLALAAGSTLAGNLTLLGAASNIIVLEAAERRGETFSFLEFARSGIPTTLITSGICIVFLSLF